MLYLIMFVYMLAFPIIIITLLWKVLDKLEKNDNYRQVKNKNFQRKKHPGIGRVNYSSPISGRKSIQAYEKYKNTDGLYEPLRPHNGIPIKKEE